MPEHLLSWLGVLVCLPGCVLAAYLALRNVVASRALLPLTLVLAPALLGVAFVGALALAAVLDTRPKGTSTETPPAAQPYAERTRPAPEGTLATETTTLEETTSPETTPPKGAEPPTIPERTTTTETTVPATTGPTASSPTPASPSASPGGSPSPEGSSSPSASPSPSAQTRPPR